jgi:dTDP-4-dehydrorhamnose reductase
MKFLITGAKGQLAREFLKVLKNDDYKIKALDREGLDVSDSRAVLEAVSYYRPDVVINCAAYNFVDKAEEDSDIPFKVNSTGPKNLASACKKHNALLIHYSTDYIFDGTKEEFYTEQDKPNPINIYGRSKLEGEELLKKEMENFLIFRVSWVFGEGKQNFLYKLKEWAKKQKVIKVACDQISVPTYTEDIVMSTILSIKEGLRGVYHLTNSGYASRYEVARYFFERLGSDRLILPVSSDYFNTTVTRPYFSAMSNVKLSEELGLTIPDWKDGVDRFTQTLH